MAFETLLSDGMAHTGAGIALALLDFITSKVANPKRARLEQKKRCLEAIEVLLDTEKSPQLISTEGDQEENGVDVHTVPRDSVQYAEHVATVREYLRSSGLVKLQLPLFQKIKDGVKSVLVHEKINDLSNLQKLGVAIGVELLYGVVFGFYILKQNPVAVIAANLYQIPAFWLGLWVGNGLKTFINLLITPGEEKKLDRMIQQLLQQTDIVKIIVAYQPPEEVQRRFAEKGLEIYTSQLTRVGQNAFKNLKQLAESAKDAADDVLNFPQKHAEQETQKQEERRKRFDDLTKGR